MDRLRRPIWEQFDLHYFRRLPPFRWWKRWLSVGCALIALVWATASLLGGRTIYSSGDMSVGHAIIAHDCTKCHQSENRFARLASFSSAPSAMAINDACMQCHAVSISTASSTGGAAVALHFSTSQADVATDAETLACSACHREHEGPQRLIELPDAACVRCHADLPANVSDHPVAEARRRINDFHSEAGGHPNWRVLSDPAGDPGTVFFNHGAHLHPADHGLGERLKNNSGEYVVLHCDDCHRAGDSHLPWRFAATTRQPHGDLREAPAASPALQDAYMGEIRYALHCAGCHAKEFRPVTGDKRLEYRRIQLAGTDVVATGLVPHDTPLQIRNYLRGQLETFLSDDARRMQATKLTAELKDRTSWKYTQIPDLSDLEKKEYNQRVDAYVADEIAVIENELYHQAGPASSQPGQACRKCHQVTFDRDDLAIIAQPAILKRWLVSASFNHEKHKAIGRLQETVQAASVAGQFPTANDLTCLYCHRVAGQPDRGTDQSTRTADVLLGPGIASCRGCHSPPGTHDSPLFTGGVSSACTFCHTYHQPPYTSRYATSPAESSN